LPTYLQITTGIKFQHTKLWGTHPNHIQIMAQLISLKVFRLQNVSNEFMSVNRGTKGFELELLSMLTGRETAKI
jgi:hypothetical protein